MSGIKVSLDHKQYRSKPGEWEAKEISIRIGDSPICFSQEKLIHFAQSILRGQTFCPATFLNKIRNKDNFEQMQLFALDFDNKIALADVINRTEEYELPILFAYETFTSVDYNKFRIVFLNDIPITDIRIAQMMQNALMTIFPEADNGCKSVVHMYYGGKNQVCFDATIPTIDIESLIRNMTYFLKEKHGDTHYKKQLEKFAKSNAVALTKKGMLDIALVEDTLLSGDGFIFNKSITEHVGAKVL
jgi:hypothetical protein